MYTEVNSFKVKESECAYYFCLGFNYLALRKSSGMCPCTSVNVIVKLWAAFHPVLEKKSRIFTTIQYYIGKFSLYHIVVEIFHCLWAIFKFHQHITVYSSIHFLKNVWNDFRKCDIKFNCKRDARNQKEFKYWKSGI